MRKHFSFPCREAGYKTKEGRQAVDQYISDKIKGYTLMSIVKEKFTADGEKWINFTVSYK